MAKALRQGLDAFVGNGAQVYAHARAFGQALLLHQEYFRQALTNCAKSYQSNLDILHQYPAQPVKGRVAMCPNFYPLSWRLSKYTTLYCQAGGASVGMDRDNAIEYEENGIHQFS